MTPTEFKYEFDILYNNLASNAAPPINDYEKSVFLTRAQEEIVWGYIRPQTNGQMIGIDADALRRNELGFLITRDTLYVTASSDPTFGEGAYTITYPSTASIMAILSETALFKKGNITIKKAVIPLSAEELTRVSSKNYCRPPKKQAWKIAETGAFSETVVSEDEISINKTNERTCTFIVDIPTDYSLINVLATYIRFPQPIIIKLTDGGDLTIRGKNVTEESDCELPEFMHPIILQRAVELARQYYIGGQVTNK